MTLFNAIGEMSRGGKSIVSAVGQLSPLGILVLETPFAKVDGMVYTIKTVAPAPPTTIVCTYEIQSNIITVSGWMPSVGFMPFIPSNGEEFISVVIVGKTRQ